MGFQVNTSDGRTLDDSASGNTSAGLGGAASGFGGHFSSLFEGPGDAATANAVRNGQKYNYLGDSPYQSSWNNLLDQLHNTAMGNGPSLAGMAYRQASMNGQAAQVAMSRGRSAGAARAGALGLAQQQQGYAQGYGQARTAEEMAAQSQYQNALASADQSQFNRDQSNQNAFLQALKGAQGQQSTAQKVLGAIGQGAAAYGAISGGGAAKGAAPMIGQAPDNFSQGPGAPGNTAPYVGGPGSTAPNAPYQINYDNYFRNSPYGNPNGQ